MVEDGFYEVNVYRLDWDENMTPQELIDGDVRQLGMHHYRVKLSGEFPKCWHTSIDHSINSSELFGKVNEAPKRMILTMPVEKSK